MDAQKVLENILADYVRDFKASKVVQAIERKIGKGICRYTEAEMMAQESGRILESAFRKYLPEALTDGKLFRETAEIVLKNPMLLGSRDVRDAAVRIQRGMNEAADIGIDAIVPEVNEDQINGIITGICNAESFEAGEEKLYDQVGNFLEGYVDDFVHDNAEFQYQAGMEPKVIRTAAGKCCTWCDNLAGTYLYEDVRDKGNDVWRRHNNCHCLVEYDPGKKDRKRVRVGGPRSTDPGKTGRIAFAEAGFEKPDAEAAAAVDLERTQWEKVNPNRKQRIQGGFAAFPENDRAGINVLNVKPKQGYFDVAMHGETDSVGFGTKAPNMKAKDLARIIRRDESYHGGPVRLLSCSTGQRIGDEYCFAEELANALGQKVEAPNAILIIQPNGDLKVGLFGEGEFITFEPNERRRIR